ncbi:ATP-binding protein [Thiorhodococcus mannitoliphagus]|uniref:ATP-binding protein n=1 Tax=Thiorhodococcus mannitoliphagus TaxID=329406 RepID=A0A6P1E2H1_9GAMM|nr:ATP-binding protein [Thiorhodococcus mannitoliphagus]NEX21885.1 ATP-binding protein [Thiorhodococcus mannitoliphagus]
MTRLKLPIGIQTFSKLREDGCYYVDKTPLMLKLVEEGTHYFLSRPRRFGKSLLIDTLAELFEGNEPLFRGLYAHERWDWSRRTPVIRLSFAEGVLHSRADLDAKIEELLAENETRLAASGAALSLSGRFSQLIRQAHALTGERVVVLVDEYDKPILDNLTRPEIAREMRDGLRNLYSVIKGQDAHIRFAFLTGVSKFSKVSIFSGLNNLNDITVDAEYSALCGYTEHDLETVFAPEVEGLDRDEIRRWYNGYNWTGESVYNPFDVLLLFQKRQFRPWWFETGTPRFLVDVLTERGYFTPNLAYRQTSLELLSTFDVEQINSDALLFQTGYLTIHKVEEPLTGYWVYTLGYPNHEVETSLNAALLIGYGVDGQCAFANRLQLLRLLETGDRAGLHGLFDAFFASIPSDWFRNNPIARYEGYYASVFYSYFAALGLDIVLEDASRGGRLDMAVRFKGQVYLFEFKVVELEPEGRALQQIKDRGYADKYRADGQPIHLIGVEFSRERRAVVGFEVETLTAGAID